MGVVKRIIFFFLLLFVPVWGISQETPEVHKIDGKKYYLHIVEQGNTLYGISRKYDVSLAEIEKENKELLVDGLKVNQTLKIPVNSSNRKELPGVEQDRNVLIHSVQPGQTLYSISQQYNTSLEALLEANPDVAEFGLRADSQIRIPIKEIEAELQHVRAAKPDSLKGHKVLPGETLYSISRMYNVKVEDLVKANDGLQMGLTGGMMVRIPGTSTTEEAVNTASEKLTSLIQKDSSAVYHIGLLLPMNPSFPYSANARSFKISPSARVALSFYRGFTYALDSLDTTYPLDIVLDVFSANGDSGELDLVFNNPNFDSLDILVGPFYSQQFERSADKMLTKGVITICPINKPSKILFHRPNAIKTVPSESMQLNTLASYAANNLKDSNLVLVNSNKFQDTQNIEFFKDRYSTYLGLPDTVLDEGIKEVKLWDINRETLGMRFKDTGEYVLIVPSKDQVFVTKLLSGLYDYVIAGKGKYAFKVIGMAEWRNWEEGLNLRHLHTLKVTIPVPEYVDMKDTLVTRFYTNYTRRFGFEPDLSTIQGFDLSAYLMKQLYENPSLWFAQEDLSPFQGVVSDFDFKRVMEDSGMENEFVQFYQYQDYQLKPTFNWSSQRKK